MSAWLGVLLVSILSCLGQLCQKQATSPPVGAVRSTYALRWLFAALLLLGIALLLWLVVLQQLPVGIAYPMLSLNLVWVTLAARWIWREPIDARHTLGILFIIVGVILLGATG
ncbi:4-amino-4-deoxy-L-arabinose-phosphoundecaprenol flippase subunit ArnE [Candidatus Symbiopectobacterium sp. NZEC135]|uniref:4-amino-4-deoxy-L-arabinose-phosphoundecaprenol flippase subunit ArnE n=1 Tax=Candidatus Symbiopectobacterium sp. NZEC135 TaxID=2820471 RepID=UPI002225D09F|nr:4-amino-4-deoxy-L-arabinose-phosphoundecaprenol flippase subunit ArnE [Candidatus Symbiopectobacterium sp. NZEC135]MCW2481552.1 4-amino-4-deoxy-L-arabinose-phosphoundecaprenol flippase subunit ArnE [Candidatus Symbiopectobacterium sp. NZEC135]